MKYLLMFSLIILTGCSPSSEDYAQLREMCKQREGQYFINMIPTLYGPRLGAGCLEK